MTRSLPSLAAALVAATVFASAGAQAAASQPGQISSVRPGEGAPARTAATMDRTDRKFAQAAAQAGLAEIAAARVALQRSRDQGVREYAQHLVSDHEAANANLQRIAAAKGIALPSATSAQQQRDLRSLQQAGKDFDQHFLEQMVRDHQKAVDLFGHEIKGRHQDATLKDFAQQTLPHLERHLSQALTLQKRSGYLPG